MLRRRSNATQKKSQGSLGTEGACPVSGLEGRPDGEYDKEDHSLLIKTVPQEVAAGSFTQCQGCPETHSPTPAPEALDAAVAHAPTGHTSMGSVWGGSAGTSVSPAPLVRNAATVCGPAGGNRQALAWRSTGARPRDRRVIPPGLLSDSDTDEEAPVSYRVASPEPLHGTAASGDNSSSAAVSANGMGTPSNDSMSGTAASHFVCQECDRAFGTKIGLSQHRRHAHVDEYNADINVQRCKPRWHKEEEYLMAVYEVELRRQKVYNLNQKLHQKFPMRTFDGIKSHRRDDNYRKLVDELMRRQTQDPGHDDPDGLPDNAEAPREDPEVTRAAVCEEMRQLTSKPPPKSYQAARLWELGKRFISGELIYNELNAYLRDCFSVDNVRHVIPQSHAEESRRRKKKRVDRVEKGGKGWIGNRWERPSSCSGPKQADDDDDE
ncbi:hypothetical protein HPB50_029010 [Hyalomma asiaticum]|nr:hypothetical protein HPB50_029010 [Hyalomma asiaticum]